MRPSFLTRESIFIGLAVITGAANGLAVENNPGSFDETDDRAKLSSTLVNNMVYELRFPGLGDKCMDVTGSGTADGTNIQLWSCNNVAAQRFKVMAVDANHFQIVSINSGRCVDVDKGGTEDGTNVQLYGCNGSDAQAFRFEALADGSFDIPNRKSGRCLDVSKSSSADGANVQIWGCNQSTAQKVRLVPTPADAMIEAFNATYLVERDGLTYYRESLNNGGVDYFWRQALNILALEDAQIRLSNVGYREKIKALLNTFIHHNGPEWSWNDYNDDLAWAGLAFVRGYKITGNYDYFVKAKNAFDLAYGRDWTGEFGGGIWWDRGRTAKEALSNNPTAILACHLYQNSGNTWYRDRAVDIYNWVRNTLYDANTGAVYQGIRRDGQLMADVSAYNVGTFVEAANCLQKITGQSSPYFNDAIKAADYVKNNQTQNGIMPIGSSEFARGIGEFIRDNKLQKRYLGWLEENSRAAWNTRRGDLGVTWNKWRESSPSNEDISAMDAKDAVTMLQVAPL